MPELMQIGSAISVLSELDECGLIYKTQKDPKTKEKDFSVRLLNYVQSHYRETDWTRELKLYLESKKLINKLVPEPENVTASDIVKDMGRLSILGFLPVAGGIAGGVAGDLITDKPNWKNKFPNKIKEGAYQYLANIFLCNVGAAAALGIMEAAKVTSKSARALGMVGGIIATGVVGGSAIANYISKKVINPLFDKGKQKNVEQEKSLYSDRKPEMLDVCLHTDDVATIAVMSGFKWIEPSLPILYAISGYRAGIGYRNGSGTSNQTIPHEHKHEFCRQNKKK